MQYNRLNNPNALIDLIKALENRVTKVETKGTGPIGFVGSDGVELHIGVQPDGQAAIVPFVGDVTPPPIATSPDASAGPGFITVTWDGLFVNGETMPLDFEHLNVVGSRIVNGVSNLTVEVGIIRNPMDSCLVGTEVAAVGETWEFVFVSEDYNGNLSAISAKSNQVVQKSFAADVLIDEALGGLQQDFINAQSAAASAQKAADDAQDAADEAALILTKKGTVYTQSVRPEADPNGLWIDTGHKNLPRYYVGKGRALFVNYGSGASVGSRLTALGWTVTTVTATPTLADALTYDLVAFDAGYAALGPATQTLAKDIFNGGVSVFTSGNDTTSMAPLFLGSANRGATSARNPIRPSGTAPGTGWANYNEPDNALYLTGVDPSAIITGVTMVGAVDQPVLVAMEHATNFARWTHVHTYATPASVLDAHLNWISDNWVAIQDQAVVESIAAAQLKADQAFNNAATAAEAAGNAQETADKKNTNWYQDDQPAGTSHKVGDNWFDTNDGYKLRTWNGSIWQTTQDSALAQQIAESKGRTYTQDFAPPVEARNDKNLWIDTSAGVGLYVTKYWNGTTWTALTNKDAADAQETADSKGETIYSSTEPAADKRLPQNTWIDTSGGLNIQKRWDGFAWVVVVDSRIPSTAAAVTAVDSRVTSVSSSASAQFGTVNSKVTSVSAAVTSVDSRVTGVSAATDAAINQAEIDAAADAKAKADAAEIKAIEAQAYSTNPTFENWTSVYPVGFSAWSALPTKETSILRTGTKSVRYNIPDATTQAGMQFQSILSHASNLEYFTVEVDLYLVSGTLDGSGIILDWNGLTPNRAQIQFKDELPGAIAGKWYRVSKTLRRPTNASGTWTSMGGYLMGQWSGHGTGSAKNIIFDWFNIRPATTEEVLAYNAPADAQTKANTAQANATTAAQQNTMLATAYSKNPSFDDWAGSWPDSYGVFGAIGPVKDTTNKRVGAHGMKFTVPGTEDAGIEFSTPTAHMPNLQFVTVEVEFMLISGSLSGAGVLLDWLGLAAPNRAYVKLTDLVSSPSFNKWYRVSAVVERRGGAGTWTATKGWLMANWSELGTKTAKTIVYDWLNVRPSTAEEILSYKAPTADELYELDTRVTGVSATASTQIGAVDTRVTGVSAAAASEIDTVDSRVTGVSAAAASEIETVDTRVTGVSSTVTFELDQVDTRVSSVSASVTSVDSRVTGVSAAASTQIGTVDSRVTSVSSAANTQIGSVDSRVTSVSAAASGQISTVDSRVTSVSSAANTQIGTVDSRVTGVSAAANTQIGTVDSRVTSVSSTANTQIGGVDSRVTSVSAGVTSVDSRVTGVSAAANTQIGTVDSRVTSVSSTASTQIGTVDSKVSSVSAGVTSVDSRVTGVSAAANTQIGTVDSRVTSVSSTANTQIGTVDSKVTSVSAGVTSVDSRVTGVSATANTQIGTVDSRVTGVSAAASGQIGTVDSRVTGVSAAANTQIGTVDSKVTSVSAGVTSVDSRVTGVSAAADTKIGTVDSRVTAVSASASASFASNQAAIDQIWAASRSYVNDATSIKDVQNMTGVAPTVVDSTTAMGGKAIQKSGANHGWWHDNRAKQAYDPTALYRMTLRVRVVNAQTNGSGKGLYWGFAGLAANGTTYVNGTGADSYSSQQWAYQNVQVPTTGAWVDYVAYYRGLSATTPTGSGQSITAPRLMHADTRYVVPSMILDYASGNGTWEISHWSIDVIDSAGYSALVDAYNKSVSYYQDDKPTGGVYKKGDTWYDTNDGNKLYVHNGTDFVLSQDADIAKSISLGHSTDWDINQPNKWAYTKFVKTTAAGTSPTFNDIAGLTGVTTLITDTANLVQTQGDNYIGQLRTIVNVAATKTVSWTMSHDDGARVYVNGTSIYSAGAVGTNAPVSVSLAAGWHVIDILWAEQAGGDGVFAFTPLLSTQVTNMYAPVSLTDASATATSALTAANGKNKVIWSASDATGTSGYIAGDTWFKRDANGAVIRQWEFTNAWQERTVSEAVLGNISAGKIVAPWLEAGLIKAGAISASALSVTMGGNNLVYNSSFEVDSNNDGLADGWNTWTRGAGDAGRVFTNTRPAGLFPGSTYSQRVTSTTVTNTEQSSIQGTQLFAIGAGDKVTLSLYIRASVSGNFSVAMRCEDDGGVYKGDANFTAPVTTTTQRFFSVITIPAGTTRAKVTITTPNALTNGHWFEVDGVKAELGDVLSAWSPATAELLPGTINATMLTADAINGKVITGPTIQTEVTAARGIKLTPTEFMGYDGTTGNKAFSLTSGGTLTLKGAITTGSTITGATITGGLLQTEVTPSRGIKIDTTEMVGYDASGNKNFSLTTGGTLALKGNLMSGSSISGASVSASGIYTNALANRGIKLLDTGITAYDGSGNVTFKVDSATGLVEAPGIKAGSISSAMISATALDARVITGSTFQSETTANRGLKLTSTELSGFDGTTGNKSFSLTSAGALYLRGEIKSGSTIEGAKITGTQGLETSTVANTGVKINNAGIKAYDAGNNLTFSVDAATGLVKAPGLEANSIKGDMIAADAVTAKHLSIGDFTNLAYGGEFNSPEDLANWSSNIASAVSYTTSAPHAGAGCVQVVANASLRVMTLGTSIAVQPGDKFNIEFYYKTTGDVNGTVNNSKFRLGDQTGAHLLSVPFNTVQTAWTKVTATYEVPASGVTAMFLTINFDHTVGTVWLDSLVMRKQVGVTLIQDGAITTDKIISSGIDGGRITAGTLTSVQIKAKSILADDLVISSTDNLVVEADFGNNGTSWDLAPAYKFIMADRGRGGLPALRIVGATTEVKARNLANKFTVDPANRYRASISVRSTEALAAGKVKMYLRCYTTAIVFTEVEVLTNDTALVADTWTNVTGILPELPAGTLAVEVIVAAQNSAAGTWTEIDYVSLTRAMDASLVVDGSVTAAKIDAEAVNATHLSANSVTASAIDTHAVTADKLESELVLATKIVAGNPEGTRAEMNSEGFRVFAKDDPADPLSPVSEVVRMGVANTNDYFAIVKADGTLAASMSQEGGISSQSASINGEIEWRGESFTQMYDALPKGIVAWGSRSYSSPYWASGSNYQPYLSLTFDAVAGRAYRVWSTPITAAGDTTTAFPMVNLHYALGSTINTSASRISQLIYDYNGVSADRRNSLTFNRLVTPSTTSPHTFLISYGAALSNGGRSKIIATSAADAVILVVEDIGLAPAETGESPDGSADSGTTNPPPPPTKVNYVKTYYPTATKSYTGTGAQYNYNTSYMYSGLSPAGMGDLRSLATFSSQIATDVGSGTITKVRVYAYYDHWYYNSGGTADITVYGGSTIPETLSSVTGTVATSTGWPKPGGRWVTLSSTTYAGFKAGTSRGIIFGGKGRGYLGYGFLHDVRLEVSYTK